MNRRIGVVVIVILSIFSSLLIPATPGHAAETLPAAKIIFTFDDGWADCYTYAFPIMEAAGFKGTSYVMRDWVIESEPDFMDESQLDDLYNAGWDISNHTTKHDDWGADTSPDRLALLETEYQDNQDWILSNGWTRGAYHVCYPSGGFSDDLIDILKGMGVLTGRSVINGIQSVPVDDFFRIPVQWVGAGNVAQVEDSIDSAIVTGKTIVLMLHRVMPTEGDLVTLTSDFQEIVDYVNLNSASIAVMTMSEWYNSFTNQPPVLAPIGSKSGTVGQPLTFTISATDPDSDPLTFSATGLPAGATFNPATRTFTWTPSTAGTFTGVRFNVSDGGLNDFENITFTISINPNPQPPVLAPIGSKSGTVSQPLTFTVSATDPNSDPLTFSASGLPAGSNFNPSTRTFTWTPSAAGIFTCVHFTVSDGSLTDFEDITITISSIPTLSEITCSVAIGSDDGFSGAWGFYPSLVWYEDGNPDQPYNAWFRFTGITIPAGATIMEAHLETIQEQWSAGTALKISAEKASAPTAPTSTANQTSRVRTTTSVNWTSGYADSVWHNSPDFASVIQELVNSYNYSSGSAIQLLIDNNGSSSDSEHVGNTFESGSPPRLYIKYQAGTPLNYAPVINPIGIKNGTVGQPLTFTISATDPDSNPLTFSASGLPAGATFDPATRIFIWTPSTAGTFTDVRFTVSDGSLSSFEDITITIIPIQTYTVTYNGNGATSGTVPGDQTKIQDVPLTLATNTGSLAKTGFTFCRLEYLSQRLRH